LLSIFFKKKFLDKKRKYKKIFVKKADDCRLFENDLFVHAYLHLQPHVLVFFLATFFAGFFAGAFLATGFLLATMGNNKR